MTEPTRFTGFPGFDDELNATAAMLLADLRCPVGVGGITVALEVVPALETLKLIMGYHLPRAGWRMVPARRLIKARKIYGTGTLEGAVDWVDIGTPDDPLANLPNMTLAQIDALEPPDVRLEARRRLGLPNDTPGPPQAEPWHTDTRITITDAPDTDEG